MTDELQLLQKSQQMTGFRGCPYAFRTITQPKSFECQNTMIFHGRPASHRITTAWT